MSEAPTRPPVVDVVDSTWVNASASALSVPLAEPANWRRWWPGLTLNATELRGEKGVRWSVRRVAEAPQAALHGSAEIWLQPVAEGVIVHFFLRLDPGRGASVTPRQAEAVCREYRRQAKRAFWTLADQLDPGRFVRHTSVPPPAALP